MSRKEGGSDRTTGRAWSIKTVLIIITAAAVNEATLLPHLLLNLLLLLVLLLLLWRSRRLPLPLLLSSLLAARRDGLLRGRRASRWRCSRRCRSLRRILPPLLILVQRR